VTAEACLRFREELAALRQGEEAGIPPAELRAHLQSCAECRLAEAQAMSRVAYAILHSALARTESRGAHFRNDYPKHDDEHFQKHSSFTDGRVAFQEW
jgi:succinate dehydrogenase/fumarate reductase flavoprotein subunit